MTNEPTRANGVDLNERQMQALDFTFADHLRVVGELEDVRRQNVELLDLITRSKVEIEALRSFNNLLESRVNAAIAERDLAVGQRAKYEALFSMMLATMREFNVPAVPLIREMESKNASENSARQRRA
jgi:hypothetical protein